MTNDVIAFLRSLSPDDWGRRVTSKWTVRDVVAHLVGWEHDDPAVIRTVWKTKEPPWWQRADDFADYNQKNVERYRDYTPEQLVREFEKCQQAVQAVIDEIGEGNLREHLDLFGWLFEGPNGSRGNGHILEHIQQIKEVINITKD